MKTVYISSEDDLVKSFGQPRPDSEPPYDPGNTTQLIRVSDPRMEEWISTAAAGHRAGMWAGFNEVLNYLNTLEDATITKKTIYAAVQSMKPHPQLTDEDIRDIVNGD